MTVVEKSKSGGVAVEPIGRHRSVDEGGALDAVRAFTGQQKRGSWRDQGHHLLVVVTELFDFGAQVPGHVPVGKNGLQSHESFVASLLPLIAWAGPVGLL